MSKTKRECNDSATSVFLYDCCPVLYRFFFHTVPLVVAGEATLCSVDKHATGNKYFSRSQCYLNECLCVQVCERVFLYVCDCICAHHEYLCVPVCLCHVYVCACMCVMCPHT